jgi:hypothetical protein
MSDWADLKVPTHMVGRYIKVDGRLATQTSRGDIAFIPETTETAVMPSK